MNLLFVCSRNEWRSPTAESVYKTKPGFQVRSAGTSPSARIKLNEKAMTWADVIFVMEKRHKQIIDEKFSLLEIQAPIIVLDIADEYQYMDAELIEEIESKVDSWLKNLPGK